MKNKHQIRINPETCIGCGLCRRDCPAGNIRIKDKKAKVITQECIMCGHCVAICPKAAVSMTGFEEPPEEIEKPAALDPGELLKAIQTRRSIRQFTKRRVEPELITQIIEAGRLTPTGGNAQNVSFIMLNDRLESAEKLAVGLFRRLLPLMKLVNPLARRMSIDDHFFFKKAPAAIVIVAPSQVDGARRQHGADGGGLRPGGALQRILLHGRQLVPPPAPPAGAEAEGTRGYDPGAGLLRGELPEDRAKRKGRRPNNLSQVIDSGPRLSP